MKTIVIKKMDLVEALVTLAHVASLPDVWPYKIAFNLNDVCPQGRVIWADTPSSMGGYFQNFQGEENFSPDEFLDYSSGNSFSWEEDDDVQIAREWIAENLLEEVNLDSVDYRVIYF